MVAMESEMRRITQVESTVGQLRGELADYARSLDGQKVELEDNLSKEFTQHKLMMGEIIEGARKEFAGLKADLKQLYDATDAALKVVMKKIDDVELDKAGGGEARGGTSWKNKGYIPEKHMIPKTFSNQEDEWRQWQDDVSDYFDHMNPGMRKFLKLVEAETEPVTEDWVKSKSADHAGKVLEDQVAIWRALKSLTDGEARKVVMSVGSENGFRAWQRLHMRFGPSLSARQGLVLMELSGMVAKPAKTPGETRFLITELERRVKLVEDVTGEDVSDNHVKSILVGFLDPTTRQHTAMAHGSKYTSDQLKKVVLEFVNNVTPRKDDNSMQIGRVGVEADHTEEYHDHGAEETYIGAVGGWGQCYKCQGYGHLARECPSKGKGKGPDSLPLTGYGKVGGKGVWQEPSKGKGKAESGKGGPKGKGKGKRAPMYGACWTCGGAHFANECPSKGKGKGGKGLNTLEEDWGQEESPSGPSVKALSHFSIVGVEREETSKDDEGWKLVNYVKKKTKQGDVKRERRQQHIHHQSQPPQLQQQAPGLRLFQTIEPEGVNAVKASEWEEIEMAVDSGASETVIGEDMLTSIETKEGPASKRGVQYEVANGVRIPNLGEKHIHGFTDEGMQRSLKAQVCDVNKALLSVHKLVQTGHRVVFDSQNSYIEDRDTKEKMWLQEKGGMYMLKLWVRGEGF